jgi:hypothetical protein
MRLRALAAVGIALALGAMLTDARHQGSVCRAGDDRAGVPFAFFHGFAPRDEEEPLSIAPQHVPTDGGRAWDEEVEEAEQDDGG